MSGGEATVLLTWSDGNTRTVMLEVQSGSGRWQITSMKVSR